MSCSPALRARPSNRSKCLLSFTLPLALAACAPAAPSPRAPNDVVPPAAHATPTRATGSLDESATTGAATNEKEGRGGARQLDDTRAESASRPPVAAAAAEPPAAEPRRRAAAHGRAAPAPAPPSAARAEAKEKKAGDISAELGVGSLGLSGTGVGGGGYGRGRGALAPLAASPQRVARPARLLPLQQVQPGFNTEAYAHVADNVFLNVADSPLSTFSIDVDTASYSNVRRYLQSGTRPPLDAVRIEELINYFRYAYPAPKGDDPFAVYSEVAPAPWSPRHRLVQVGLRAKDIEAAGVPARNLVFLIDVSGSMQDADKLPLLKQGLGQLARTLRAQDRIAIVVYAGASGLVLPSTPGDQQGRILAALDALEAGGSTNGAAGIELAYRVAAEHFVAGGINRVLLATDGDFNVGATDQGALTRLIEDKRKSGVFLTVLGFGGGNLKDATMESLADHGNGNYAYIDSAAEANKVLVRQAGATLVTVAKDVKLQVEWNPKRVASYRLIGYENRALADRDFNDDKKDAGEMGAGHTVTALYEVVLAHDEPTPKEVDPLKYQAARGLTAAADSEELMTLKVRYKQPSSERSALRTFSVVDEGHSLAQSSADFRFAAAVAGFGMLLRGSEQRGDASLELVEQLARSAVQGDPSGDRAGLLDLMQRAKRMGIGG